MCGHKKKGGLLMAAAVMLATSMPANAMMGCWNETQLAAAKVRDLQQKGAITSVKAVELTALTGHSSRSTAAAIAASPCSRASAG